MGYIDYQVKDRIAVLTLNRPEARNAQNRRFLLDLDEAWTRAARDKDVRVIVVAANGPHFSAGHDLGDNINSIAGVASVEKGDRMAMVYETESEIYFGFTQKWRDVPKPSIAAVHGACIGGGLMLAWPCDLIIASQDAWFQDPTVQLGLAGVEYPAHTWELGARKAKELLFTGARISADEARELGMVNRVVPREKLLEETMELAKHIATLDPFVVAQAKRAVNITLDIQGQRTSLRAAFDIHETTEAHALARGAYDSDGHEAVKK